MELNSKHKFYFLFRRHKDEKPYSCDFCQKKFADSSACKQHMRRHVVENPNGRVYNSDRTAMLEERLQKGEEPSFKCQFCHAKFNTQVLLEAHEVVHTSKPPYECLICNKKFNKRVNFANHHRMHCDDFLFECHICPKKFFRNSDLEEHRKSHLIS